MEENKNYYEDILDNQFVPLERGISNDLLGKYEINKLGEVRRIKTGVIYSAVVGSDGYYRVSLPITDGDSVSRGRRGSYIIHRLLAFTFLYNDDPTNKKYIDHLDRNPENNNLENLSWATSSQNMKNRVFNKKLNDKFIYIKKNPITGDPIEIFTSDQLGGDKRSCVYKSIRENKLYQGCLWEVIDTILEKFIENYGEPKEWKQIVRFKERRVFCSDNGLIKYENSGGNFEITPGHENKSGYMVFNYGKKGYRVHRLVYETFLNGGKELDSKIEIDHINCDSRCNCVSNLKLCSSHKENMNNPKTKINLGRPVKMYSTTGEYIRTFNTIIEAYIFLGKGLNHSKISLSCLNKRPNSPIFCGYLWCYPGEEHVIEKSIKNIIYQYSPKGLLINTYNVHHAVSDILAFDKKMKLKGNRYQINKAIKSGKLAPDGFYYSRGPRNFDNEDE